MPLADEFRYKTSDAEESESEGWNPYNARGLVYASSLAYSDSLDSISSTLSGWGFDAERVAIIYR